MKNICCAIVLCVVLLKHHKCVKIRNYFGYRDFKSGSVRSVSKLWTTSLKYKSKLKCFVASVRDDQCHGFLYDSGICTGVDTRVKHSTSASHEQIGHTWQTWQTSLSAPGTGTVFYSIGRRTNRKSAKELADSWHGSACKRKRDCRMKKSVCHGGICLCELGLYFSPKLNACLRECDEYGDGMDLYDSAGIGGNNDKTYYKITQTRCSHLCVLEQTFTCLTAEWKKPERKCYLSESGFLDVFFTDRQYHIPNFSLAQRQCK